MKLKILERTVYKKNANKNSAIARGTEKRTQVFRRCFPANRKNADTNIPDVFFM